MIHRRILPAVVAVLLLAVGALVQAADPPVEEGFRRLSTQWDQQLRSVETQLAAASVNEATAERIRDSVENIRAKAQSHARNAQRRVDQFSSLIDALGAPPKPEEPPEPVDVKTKREQLGAAKADLEGQVKQSILTITRADDLLTQLTAAQFERRKLDLLSKGPLPLMPQTWLDAGKQIITMVQAIHTREVKQRGAANLVILPLVALGTLAAAVVGRMVRRRIQSRWGRDPALPFPTYSRRLVAAVVEAVSRGLIPVLIISAGLATAWWLFAQRFLDPSIGAPTWLLYAIVVYLIAAALVRAAFSPDQPNWRLAPISALASEKIGNRLNLLTAVFAVQVAVAAFLKRFGEPAELAALHSTAINLLLGILLLSMLPPSLWKTEDSTEWFIEKKPARLPALSGYLRYALAAIAIVAIGANLLGYHTLANYLLRTTIFTLLLAGATYAFRFLARESWSRLLTASSLRAHEFQRRLGLSEKGAEKIGFWSLTAVDLASIGAALVIGLSLWGIPPKDVGSWIGRLFGSISIGSHRFSLTDLVLAIAVFIGITTLTRILQNFFDHKLLPHTNLDVGARTALTSGFGYIGVAIAILVGISTLGVDLTALAFVAGALSLGIGFGLQNICNNFISGIILLVERPVKIGDTVLLDSHEGVITKIRVRSTEITTYDRASVIIPNSHLLESKVINLTHRDRTGRIDIVVGASYDADPDQVEEILRTVAAADPRVLDSPEPIVMLTGFGDNALEFKLLAYLGDIDDRRDVPSDLRKAILRAFRHAGIDIPYPQRDIRIVGRPPAVVSESAAGAPPPAAATRVRRQDLNRAEDNSDGDVSGE
jgi:potassium-dependent mechanosensitive channel